jgi:hypothetical protein
VSTVTSAEALDHASNSYEAAEREYLLAVTGGADRDDLGAAAEQVAIAAERWSSVAYERFFFLRDAQGEPELARAVEISAEVSETLAELWRDLATAHRQGTAP